MRGLAILLALPALLVAGGAAAFADDGATIYKRCAACHLPNGAGVPGAFPPLKADAAALARTPEGRRYLALTVIRGVSGPITVGGKPFRGTMPAQAGLNDGDVAAVLNHALKGSAVKPFLASEIAGFRAGSAALNSAAVGRLRASAAVK
jgi:mono/diheme cytochrome c family protein